MLSTPVVGDFAANGWFWNPAEGGTGFMFEAQGNRAFVAFFMYEDATGKPTWYAAYGDFRAGAAAGAFSFAGDLRAYRGGQAVSSAAYTGPTSTSVGPVSIAFTGNRAQVQLPGGRTIDGQRYVIDGSGFDFANPVAPKQNQPEVGWYWNPAEGGRGYAIEVQNNRVFMAMFHYNPDGSPTWNVVQGDVSTGTIVQPFELYTGGQTLTSAYRGPGKVNLAPFALGFRNPCAGQMQLSGAPAITVRRFRIDGTDRAPGAECKAVDRNTFPATPGLRVGAAVMEPGDSVFGKVNANGEVHTHGFNLVAGRTYTFAVEGTTSGAGTLANPALAVHDANLVNLAVVRQSPSRVSFTPGTSGVYHVVVQADPAGTGSFLLTSTGTANGISIQPAPAPGSYAGNVTGSFTGNFSGNVTLVVDAGGRITGGVVQSQNPGVTLVVTGAVAAGGAVDFTATGPAGTMTFKGFLSPTGNLSGAWSGANAAGGMFVGTLTATTPPTPQGSSCFDGNVANAVGVDDPFYANAWHLKNTGPTQIVSAAQNDAALAGIDANVENVHKGGRGCTGKGVLLAVVDSGLEVNHEDLRDNVLAGQSWSFIDGSADPSPALNAAAVDHGTGVAGVAAGRGWNGKGSRGTAPFVSLVGYNYAGGGPNGSPYTYLAFGARSLAGTDNMVAPFGTRADGVGIFNYSAGLDYAAPPEVVDNTPQELAAKDGTRKLRGGRGAIYFQSSGNEFRTTRGQVPRGEAININCSEVLAADAGLLGGLLTNTQAMTCGSPNQDPYNKPYFYQVAAIHNTGVASSYSSSGAANWITGFGGEFGFVDAALISTDDSGCNSGSNNVANRDGVIAQLGALADRIARLIADLFGVGTTKDPECNYTGRMNGTSAAAPSVAGVAALMLEANPALTWRDVGFILARTARKVDTTVASTAANTPGFQANGAAKAWPLDLPWTTNAAGFNFQNRYGFGLVDADAATRMAIGFTAPAGRRDEDLVARGSASVPAKVDGAGVNTSSVRFANAGAVSGPLAVDLTVTNRSGQAINPGFLQFEITNTRTGTRSILLQAFSGWYAGGKTNLINDQGQQRFRFFTNAFLGEALDGSFEVRVIDLSNSSGDAGKVLAFEPVLTSFSL